MEKINKNHVKLNNVIIQYNNGHKDNDMMKPVVCEKGYVVIDNETNNIIAGPFDNICKAILYER